MSQNIKKDYIWNTIGVFAQNAISPLILIVVTRVNGIYDSGVFSFAFSLSLILWAFGMWGGRTYQVSDVKHEFSHQSYVVVRFILGAVIIVAAVVFSLLNHYDPTKTGIILALVVFKVVESIADAIYGILQVHERLYMVGKSLFYKALLGFGAFTIIDLLTHNILWGCIGIIGANLLVVVVYDRVRAHHFERIITQLKDLKPTIQSSFQIIKRCAPIALIIFLTMFSLNIPRYFIDVYLPTDIGLFGIIAMPITLIALLITFILQPNITQLSNLFDEGEYQRFSRIVNKLISVSMIIGLAVLILTYLIGTQALQLVFGIDFTTHKLALLIIVAGAIVNAAVTIYINILTIMRRFKAQFYTLLLTNVVLAAVSGVVIRNYGLVGGVLLYSVVNLIQAAMLLGVYQSILVRSMIKRA